MSISSSLFRGQVMFYILDTNNNPIPAPDIDSFWRWCGLNDRRVALDELKGHRVSTVFLGINHNHGLMSGRNYQPILFETIIFGPDDSLIFQERYVTREVALAGHKKALEYLKTEILKEKGETGD